jgi:hypothetical protein
MYYVYFNNEMVFNSENKHEASIYAETLAYNLCTTRQGFVQVVETVESISLEKLRASVIGELKLPLAVDQFGHVFDVLARAVEESKKSREGSATVQRENHQAAREVKREDVQESAPSNNHEGSSAT